ncbi:Fic family protein [Caulobacter hibisci]|uniref:Fic family protein n=1 Tax=Caulobacter hibisci TaxID=2035993 RepID=A0ABS0SV37_9CAUL|nr:Fic/DOC family N-terminal domain-containing protein [Caulobacter hibisci]MBI1683256.1 Fic family protein [Caulobacter hibisci]
MDRTALSHRIRETLVRLPPPHEHAYAVRPPAPPRGHVPLVTISQRVRRADQALAEVAAYALTLKDPFVVSRILTRQEAVSSSAIEGTQSTLDEILASEETQDGETRAAVKSVRRYARALDYYVKRAGKIGPAVFEAKTLRHLHMQVMREEENYRDPPGEPRTVTVWIGQGDINYSVFNPPPAALVAEHLADTLAYMRDSEVVGLGQSLVARMAIAHAHFEAVHPFRDGNGRVGRLLLPMMMAADGATPLYLSSYIEANKADYYEALKAAQQREDWPAIIGFMADAVTGSAAEVMRTRDALLALRALWSGRRKFRKGSSALRAIEILATHPVVTIGRLAGLLDVSFPAASKAVGQLVDAGVLHERTGYERNRIFAASEALAIMNRPFGRDPILPEAQGALG